MGLKRKAPAPTTFQRRLEQKNPYLFIEHWEEGKSPFKWSAEWEYLSLELSDIRISSIQEYLDRKRGRNEKSIPLVADFDERSIPKDVPDDQKKAYLDFVSNLYNDAFTKPDSERTSIISGKFSTEESRDIGFIRSGESAKAKGTTQEGHISICACTNVRQGSLWTASEHDWLHKTGEVCIQRNHPVKAAAGHAAEPSGFFLAKRDRAALRRFAMRPRAYLIGSTSNVSGS